MSNNIPPYYHQVTKNIIVAFSYIFNDIVYQNDRGDFVKVPISFAPKSKFVEYFSVQPTFDSYNTRYTLPRMAFELTGINFAPERYYNPTGKMLNATQDKYVFARIPYDFNFNLYLGVKMFEDSLKIVEQILPLFTPELNITVNDSEEFDFKTDMPVVLNSVGFDINYLGAFEEVRTIEWTLQFTVKGYVYGDVRKTKLIKETIVDLTQKDINAKYEQLISEINPKSANPNDQYTIEEQIITDPNQWKTP